MADVDQKSPQQGLGVSPTKEQWRAFWVREYTIFLKAAWVLLRNKEDAEDAVQEAFLSFDEALERGERVIKLEKKTFDETVRVYLVGVIRKKVLDKFRERQRMLLELHLEGLTDNVVAEPNSEDLSPEEELERKSLSDEVQQGVEQLSGVLKELFLFVLKHIDDSDPDEHWELWAEENGYDLDDRTRRNTFDQQKKRLREKLYILGVYQSLGGKEASDAN